MVAGAPASRRGRREAQLHRICQQEGGAARDPHLFAPLLAANRTQGPDETGRSDGGGNRTSGDSSRGIATRREHHGLSDLVRPGANARGVEASTSRVPALPRWQAAPTLEDCELIRPPTGLPTAEICPAARPAAQSRGGRSPQAGLGLPGPLAADWPPPATPPEACFAGVAEP